MTHVLIVGIGNIGTKYEGTRHNIGFEVMDYLAGKYDESFKPNKKLHGDEAVLNIEGVRVHLLKPSTYVNESGRSVQAALDYYDIKREDCLVVLDDIDLELGKIRVKKEGGDAGHKGIRSIKQHLGDEVIRLRLGVRNELRDRMDASDFVLSRFARNEQAAVEKMVLEAALLCEDFIDHHQNH